MNIQRRKQLDKMEPEELLLFALTQQIEKMGAHPLLTDAVILLGEAREKLGEYVDWALAARPDRADGTLSMDARPGRIS